jgi:uncharacterized protein
VSGWWWGPAWDLVSLLTELLTLFIVVAAGLALVTRRVGAERLGRWMGASRASGAARGLALGFVIPFCSYSAIPMLVAMIGAGARTSTLFAFLLAAPLVDPIVFALLVLLFGWAPAIAYTTITGAFVFVVAVVADGLRMGRCIGAPVLTSSGRTAIGGETRDPDATMCSPPPLVEASPWRGARTEARAALDYGVDLARGLALPLVVAATVAVVMVEIVPEALVTRVAGPDRPLAVPIAALIGVPFYVSTEAFLPIASAFQDLGVSTGAVFALIISAAGINVPELAVLSRLLAPPLLVVYSAAIFFTAVAAGYLIPAVT